MYTNIFKGITLAIALSMLCPTSGFSEGRTKPTRELCAGIIEYACLNTPAPSVVALLQPITSDLTNDGFTCTGSCRAAAGLYSDIVMTVIVPPYPGVAKAPKK